MNSDSFFYGFIDGMDWNRGLSHWFYPSIEDVVLNGGDEHGEIVKYGYSFYDVSNLTIVPIKVATYDVSTIEDYELLEYLKDEPEMNASNYIVFTRGDEGYENMMTIVKLVQN